jgi:hypothetical protein
MFSPVDDDDNIVLYDQILNRMMDCCEKHNDAYTYKYAFNY